MPSPRPLLTAPPGPAQSAGCRRPPTRRPLARTRRPSTCAAAGPPPRCKGGAGGARGREELANEQQEERGMARLKPDQAATHMHSELHAKPGAAGFGSIRAGIGGGGRCSNSGLSSCTAQCSTLGARYVQQGSCTTTRFQATHTPAHPCAAPLSSSSGMRAGAAALAWRKPSSGSSGTPRPVRYLHGWMAHGSVRQGTGGLPQLQEAKLHQT